MKVLIHSNAPWVPSGYGKQAALAGRILDGLGHGVSFSAFSGLGGQPIKWGEHAVYPSGQIPFSPDVIVQHAQAAQADVIVSIMDTYKLAPAADQLRLCGIPFVPLVVTDCEAANGGPSVLDQRLIESSSALPAAVSSFGLARLIDHAPAGWDVPYVPHAVDTSIYRPPADRQALREELGTADDFVIGIMAANRDMARKGFAEQFAAFERFSRKHKDARLALFSVVDSVGGLPLGEMAADFGIMDQLMAMPVYEQVSGLLSEEFMAKWYASLDVLSVCSYGEGFGVPALEAQACGTLVVGTDCSALSELVRPAGWLVRGHRFWNPVLRAWWTRPDEDSILNQWEAAYQECGGSITRRKQFAAVEFASAYSLEKTAAHWEGLIRDVQEWKDAASDE